MPTKFPNIRVLAQLCICHARRNVGKSERVEDRNPFTQRVVGQAINVQLHTQTPVSVAAPSKVCGRSPPEIVVSNPTGSMDVCLL